MQTFREIIDNTPKSQAEYENLLTGHSLENLEKMEKIIEIIVNQAEIIPGFESDGIINIPPIKFTGSGLLLSDVSDILYLFHDDINFMILPEFSTTSKKGIIRVDYPLRGPYAINFRNFNRALNTVIKNKSLDKKEKQNLVSVQITGMPDIVIKGSEKITRRKKQQIKEMALFLNQNGRLYREPKDKYCYSMSEKGNRHKIIRFLATNKGYQFTKLISAELGIENVKTVRSEIGKMRNIIKKYLKIEGNDFLQSKKESGYRINPKYKITFKNE